MPNTDKMNGMMPSSKDSFESLPIDRLSLSRRTYNCLRRAGINFVIDLFFMTDEQLLDIRQIGIKSLTEIREALDKYLEERSTAEESMTFELPKEDFDRLVKKRPLEILNLSFGASYRLREAEIETIGQLMNLTLSQQTRILDRKEFLVDEVRSKLIAFLKPRLPSGFDLSDGQRDCDFICHKLAEMESEFQRDHEEVPIDELGLSRRPYNALIHNGIRMVSQLNRLSSQGLLAMEGIGEKSLAEIEHKLLSHFPDKKESVQEIERISHRISPDLLEHLDSMKIAEIPVERLGLGEECDNRWRDRSVSNIGELLNHPAEVFPHTERVEEYLRIYLEWLKEQNPARIAEEAISNGISPVYTILLDGLHVDDVVNQWFSAVDERDRKVIIWRYGFCGECWTLQEAGERLGVTRERVRQLQCRSLRTLSRSKTAEPIRPLQKWIYEKVKQSGGVLVASLLYSSMRDKMVFDKFKPQGLVRLIFDMNDDVKWLHKIQAWGKKDAPLQDIYGVQKRLTKILKKEKVPLKLAELLDRFKASDYYRKRIQLLDESFLETCLKTHPEIYIGEEQRCGITTWQGHRTQEIILALREIGEPVHYSVITKRTNDLLPKDQQGTEHNIHAQMQRITQLVRVGHGIYGLKEWGLPDDGSVANAAYRVLSKAGKPLHHDIIADRVLDTWCVNPGSVYAALQSDDRFIGIGSGIFWLRDKITGEGGKAESDFGELFGDRLQQWQEHLNMDNGEHDYDTHAEADSIRETGTDFFK